MLCVADSNPQIFTESNKEIKMDVFSGEILKGTKISVWMEKCKQMEKLLCKCMIHSFRKEIIWPEKSKTGIWPQRRCMPEAWSLLTLLECSLQLHKESYYLEACKIPCSADLVIDLSYSAIYCSNSHRESTCIMKFPSPDLIFQLFSTVAVIKSSYEFRSTKIMSSMNINRRDIQSSNNIGNNTFRKPDRPTNHKKAFWRVCNSSFRVQDGQKASL